MKVHFILILQANRLAMFEQISKNEFQSLKYRGENYYDFDKKNYNYSEISLIIAEYIKEELNDDDLSKIDFTLINDNCDSALIPQLLSELVPCSKITILDFEKILPELLLKKGLIKPQEIHFVKFQNRCYKINLDENGMANIGILKKCRKSFYTLKLDEIPQILTRNYSFISDKKQTGILEKKFLSKR